MARAQSLTPEERKKAARRAALVRWHAGVLQASHEGEVAVGDTLLRAAVLPNGKRLLVQGTFLRALGRTGTPKAGTGAIARLDQTPVFLQPEPLKPFITSDLLASTTPIFFLTRDGRRAIGYDAELLPAVAEVYLKFRDACLSDNRPVPVRYQSIIATCDAIMRGLARA